jgi:hypothetical protein
MEDNPYQSPLNPSECPPSGDPQGNKSPRERYRLYIFGIVAFQFPLFLLSSAGICGCHFHPLATITAAFPILFGFYPFFIYHTKKERVIGYLTMGISCFWLYLEFMSNLRFALR